MWAHAALVGLWLLVAGPSIDDRLMSAWETLTSEKTLGDHALADQADPWYGLRTWLENDPGYREKCGLDAT